MKPIVPKPPIRPFFGTNLHGPSNKKLAIPLEAEIIEVANVAIKKRSKSVKYNNGWVIKKQTFLDNFFDEGLLIFWSMYA